MSCLVAASPSMHRHPDVHQHHVRPLRRRQGDGLRHRRPPRPPRRSPPPRGSAGTRPGPVPGRRRRARAAVRGYGRHLAARCHVSGRRAVTVKPPSAVGPRASAAAAGGDALGDARPGRSRARRDRRGEPGRGAGPARTRRRRSRAGAAPAPGLEFVTSTVSSRRRVGHADGGTAAPGAWRSAFVRASWTMRYAVRSMPAVSPAPVPDVSQVTRSPASRNAAISSSRRDSEGDGRKPNSFRILSCL